LWGSNYQGLQLLEEGDDFTMYADDGKILWQSIIHRDTATGLVSRQVIREGKLVNDREWKQQVVGGMWVHWVQAGIDPEVWGELFVREKRCLLKRTSIPEIVKNMVDLIGRKLTAYVGGVKDVRAVDRWVSGGKLRTGAEYRLRFAFQVVGILAEREDPRIIQSWLIGLSPDLGDRVPLKLLRDANLEIVGPEIMAAARIFRAGGYCTRWPKDWTCQNSHFRSSVGP
jgi:hypothetical protein